MKKRYNVNLNEESTEVVQRWLESKGMTFSGWLTAQIDEFAKAIQEQPTSSEKEVKDMTLQEFIDVAGYWLKKIQAEE